MPHAEKKFTGYHGCFTDAAAYRFSDKDLWKKNAGDRQENASVIYYSNRIL